MMGPWFFISMFPLIGAALMALLGLVLMVRGLRGEADLSFPTCGQCGYDLRGRDLTAVAACPECGKSLQEPRAVNFGRYRRRPRMALLGLAIIVLPVAIVFVTNYLQTQRAIRTTPAGLTTQSTAQILQSLPSIAGQPWAWNELQGRFDQGSLSDAEINDAISQLAAHVKGLPPGPRQPLHWADQFLKAIMAAGHVDREHRNELYEAYYNTPPTVQTRARARQGQSFPIDIEAGTPWNLPDVETRARLVSASDGGNALPKDALTGGAWGSLSGHVRLQDLGDHLLKFEVEVGLFDEADLKQSQFSMPRPVSDETWTLAIKTWKHTLEVPVTVIRPDESPVELVHDPALKRSISEIVQIKEARLRASGSGQRLRLKVLTASRRPPISLSFAVFLVMPGTEHYLGSFVYPGEMAPSFDMEFATWPESLNQIRVELRPHPKGVENMIGIDRIWGEPLVFASVPILRDRND